MADINIKEKYGDWFRDISKYVVTIMLISPLFHDFEGIWFYVWASLLASITTFISFVLYKLNNKDSKEINNKKRRK